jgi:2-phospho-L-lactate guanylyltransferase
MLKEILQVVSEAKSINDIVLVSRDESAFDIGKKFNCIEIVDENESGVNNAVSLANEFLAENDYSCSVVLPQDIPLIFTDDLDNLIRIFENRKNAIIVPSRHFDGTNALVKTPIPDMKTRYDEGSYKSQFEPIKTAKMTYSLALIHRIMIDIDNIVDVNYLIKQNIKPSLCEKMKSIFDE